MSEKWHRTHEQHAILWFSYTPHPAETARRFNRGLTSSVSAQGLTTWRVALLPFMTQNTLNKGLLYQLCILQKVEWREQEVGVELGVGSLLETVNKNQDKPRITFQAEMNVLSSFLKSHFTLLWAERLCSPQIRVLKSLPSVWGY